MRVASQAGRCRVNFTMKKKLTVPVSRESTLLSSVRTRAPRHRRLCGGRIITPMCQSPVRLSVIYYQPPGERSKVFQVFLSTCRNQSHHCRWRHDWRQCCLPSRQIATGRRVPGKCSAGRLQWRGGRAATCPAAAVPTSVVLRHGESPRLTSAMRSKFHGETI